ncbi:MAG: ABC transporter [Planctomyces sp.]|nr:ABC transporter [Planctomyces sp.]MBA4119508.1 ABC transporter [Isosphaera sp.]
MPEPALIWDSVSARYGRRTALDALSLSLAPGTVTGLLGPNGAGKSTAIALAAGLLRPTSGAVRVRTPAGPLPPTHRAARAMIGLCPQSPALYDALTARENLALLGALYGLRGAALTARAAECLELVALAPRAADRVGSFSQGMKRRLSLAAALLHSPAVVLLDEPTAGLDPHARAAILDAVSALRSAGAAVLLSTHLLPEAERLCDTAAIIDHGRLLDLAPPRQLIDRHAGPGRLTVRHELGQRTVRVGDLPADLAAAAATPGLLELRLERPGLESVFLTLTGRAPRDQ